MPCLKILQRFIFKLKRDLICQSNRTFNGFLADVVEITSCVYTKTIIKTIIFSISVNSGFGNIYLAALAAR